MNGLTGKRVTVVGLGRFGGGIAVSKWLVEQGAKVLVTDQAKPEALEDSRRQLAGLNIEYRLGEHRAEDFTSADLIVASPAVPPRSEYLQLARDRGIPITTEIRLFIERCPARMIGVTGTKGKSTTTTLLGEMLKRQFVTWVGGNMGRSLLFDLPQIWLDQLVVLELSSFMLEYLAETQWSPHVAVITMIANDHIDRHGSFEQYLDAKKNLVRHQTGNDFLVVGEDSPQRKEFTDASRGRAVLYGLQDRKPFQLVLPGQHNQLNAQAAFAAAAILGVNWDDAQEAIGNFAGLPHRLQLVHEHMGVRYFDDSIATIPEAAVAALDAFPPRSVIQIVGGFDKALDMTAMVSALVERAKAVLCIGATGDKIAAAMEQASQIGPAEVYRCGDLPTAMRMARGLARGGDVVLLSPGCASYGQFRNFEERGEIFAKLARGSES
jgi:UDP-N-acetylmuramoylalanine--D-glutamate ligase